MLSSANGSAQGELHGGRYLFRWHPQDMESWIQLWQNQMDAYPHWLVLSSVVIVGAVALWLAVKILGWLLKLVLVCAIVGLVVGLCLHFLG